MAMMVESNVEDCDFVSGHACEVGTIKIIEKIS
jgi:hypothetical protein